MKFGRKNRNSGLGQLAGARGVAIDVTTWSDFSSICKHARQQNRCPDCRPNRPRCKHGILNPSPNRPRCSACLREKAEEKVAASSEEPSTPAVRASTGRKVFPGGPWPMGLMRVSPELA